MPHAWIVTAILVLLAATVVGCSQSSRPTRSHETESLLRAARAGHADTVRALLSSPNADVNGRDEHGNTPLIEATRFGHDDVVQALLVAKADPKVRNDEGKTALTLAAEGGHDEIVRLLKQAGAVE
jgi:ankyrin repeat protein